ncbi:unnamed protein product [Dicrocoelium dendriticum]|nr:unnamed protein product [Dicrocoelium dendriticum]
MSSLIILVKPNKFYQTRVRLLDRLLLIQSECHTIGLNLKSPIVQQQQPHVEDASDLELEASVIPDTGENPLNADKQPEVHRFLTTTGACCTKNIRCFSIPLSNGSMDKNTLAGWHLFFTWLRTPESYEFGEEGWSSVGAPIGSLSGVYDLVRVRLVYVLRREAGFAVKDKADELRTFVVSSDSTERFQARVGDYYECTSGTDIVMTGENLTHTNKFSEYNLTQLYSLDPTWKPGLRVILSLTDVKAQAFADLNLPEFTGVGEL